MIEKDLVASLKTICARAYPIVMPQDVVYPAMTYQVVYDGANQATNGNFSSRDVRFQVDIYSSSYSESKSLKDSVISNVIALKGGDISSQDLYDNENKLFRQLIDFKIKRS